MDLHLAANIFYSEKMRRKRSLALLAAITFLSGGCKECQKYAASVDKEAAPKDSVSPIDRLEVVAVESDIWLLDFSGVIGEVHQFKLQYKPFGGSKVENRIPAVQQIKIGDTFFKNNPGKDRFKLIAIESR